MSEEELIPIEEISLEETFFNYFWFGDNTLLSTILCEFYIRSNPAKMLKKAQLKKMDIILKQKLKEIKQYNISDSIKHFLESSDYEDTNSLKDLKIEFEVETYGHNFKDLSDQGEKEDCENNITIYFCIKDINKISESQLEILSRYLDDLFHSFIQPIIISIGEELSKLIPNKSNYEYLEIYHRTENFKGNFPTIYPMTQDDIDKTKDGNKELICEEVRFIKGPYLGKKGYVDEDDDDVYYYDRPHHYKVHLLEQGKEWFLCDYTLAEVNEIKLYQDNSIEFVLDDD